jgi:general secretion pathway protein D
MQAYRRILSLSLLLVLGSEVLAQPAPGADPAPGLSSANTNVQSIRRRFMRRTNEVLGSSNATDPVPSAPGGSAASPAAAPATNAAPSFPAFPSFPEPPARRSQANPVPPAENATAAPAQNQGNLPLPAPGAAVIPGNTPPEPVTGLPGAAQPVPVPGAPGRTAIPMPGQAGATNLVSAEDQALLNTTPGGMPDPVNPALSADEVIPGGTLMLQGMPLDQYMDLYSLYSGRTILRPYALPAPQGLTLKAQTDLTRREVVQAMDGVLALNQITMIPVGDKFVKAVPSSVADKEGMEISTTPASQLPFAEQFLTRIVKLKTAKPSELAPTLQALSKTPTAVTPIDSNQTLILRDYASNLRRMLEVIEKVDIMPESDFTLEVIPIKYGKVQDIYSTMNALISGAGGGATTGGAAATTAGAGAFGNRSGAFGGMGAGGMGGMGSRFGGMGNTGGTGSRYGSGSYGGNRYGGSGGSYYPQEMPTEVTPQQVVPGQPSAGAAQSDFNRRLNQIVNRAAGTGEEVRILEGAQIVPDERANQLLIFANKRDMSMITNIVSKVDVMLAQVLIEAVILEVKVGDTMRLGVSAAQQPKQWGQDFSGAGAINNGQLFSSLTNFPAGSPSGFSYFGTIGDDFDVAITALASDSEINIVSRPRIQTSHAIPGSFFIGETVPYVTGSYDYGFVGSGVQSRSIINEKDVGLDLGVTPFITPEGMVVMEISQTFQQRGQDVIIDGNPIPLVNTRAASAVLTVRNGDLIMLGGFISESKSKSKSGVPFLKDIPGLGVLFRSSNKSNDRTELIILMRATVLDTPEEAAFLAQRERLQLPGVRRAEREFEESETKRLKKVEKKSSR